MLASGASNGRSRRTDGRCFLLPLPTCRLTTTTAADYRARAGFILAAAGARARRAGRAGPGFLASWRASISDRLSRATTVAVSATAGTRPEAWPAAVTDRRDEYSSLPGARRSRLRSTPPIYSCIHRRAPTSAPTEHLPHLPPKPQSYRADI